MSQENKVNKYKRRKKEKFTIKLMHATLMYIKEITKFLNSFSLLSMQAMKRLLKYVR